jgi:hypothetical protein
VEPSAPPDERERTLADIQQQLRDGKTAELIGETGMPRWFEVVDSFGSKPFLSDIDGTMQISTSEETLLDLPATGLNHYRVELQVKQLGHTPSGDFGMYTGRHRLPSTTGREVNCFASVWFNDGIPIQVAPGPTGTWTMGVRYHIQVPGAGTVMGNRGLPQEPYPPQKTNPEDGWHTITAEVRRDRLDWTFDGNSVGTITLPLAPKYEEFLKSGGHLLPGSQADFTPSGGYGLFVNQGAAAFRNARVIPLDQ